MTMDYNPKNLSNAVAKFEEEVARADAEFARWHTRMLAVTVGALFVGLVLSVAVLVIVFSN